VDVKQVQLPEAAYKALYVFARAHNLTFGDAAAQLIKESILKMMDAPVEPAAGRQPLEGVRRQVKVSKEAHTALYLFAHKREMTIGDAAALLIGVSLMKRYHLDEDAAAREQRHQTRETSQRTRRNAGIRIDRAERQKRPGV
jgi:hypothetical protein